MKPIKAMVDPPKMPHPPAWEEMPPFNYSIMSNGNRDLLQSRMLVLEPGIQPYARSVEEAIVGRFMRIIRGRRRW